MMKKFALLLVAIFFISPVFAAVNKWKDADGKTHYGDAPPLANAAKVHTDKEPMHDESSIKADPVCAQWGADVNSSSTPSNPAALSFIIKYRENYQKGCLPSSSSILTTECNKWRNEILSSTYEPKGIEDALFLLKDKINYTRTCVNH